MKNQLQKWEAKLEGHEGDLEKLPIHFRDQECRVSERDGEYILTSSELESSKDHEEANARAERLVCRVNGAMQMCDGTCQPVRLAHVVGYTESGRPTRVLSLTDTLTVRARLDLGDGSGMTGDPRIPVLVRRAASDPALDTILRELSDESVDWVRLYKVLELIEESAGGNVAKLGWCSKRQRGDFRNSANSPRTAGGRHAVTRGREPTPPPMSLDQARALMLKLSRKLADEVIAEESVSASRRGR